MTSTQGPDRVRIAVNTMRARLTLLGFNLAVITFQITGLPQRTGGAVISGLDGTIHVSPAVLLLLGAALSFAAMVAFIVSGEVDERGDCTHWSMLLGDMLMYLAMAQTVAGLFEPMLRDLEAARIQDVVARAHLLDLRIALSVAGGVAWAAAAYVGPAVSLARSPFGSRATVSIGAIYLALLGTLTWAWVLAQEAQIELGVSGDHPSWLQGLIMPLTW